MRGLIETDYPSAQLDAQGQTRDCARGARGGLAMEKPRQKMPATGRTKISKTFLIPGSTKSRFGTEKIKNKKF